MKRLFVTIMIMAFFSMSAFAISDEDARAWREGAAAYQAGDYEKALRLFSGLVDGVEQPGAELLYNLGNVYYQLGQKGRAAWMYERALKESPRYGDARENLAVVRAETGAAGEAEAFFLWRPVEVFYGWLSAGEWGLLMAVMWLALGVFATGRLLSRVRKRQRLLNVGVILFGVLFVFAACFAVPKIIQSGSDDTGVVLESGVVVRSGPTDNSEEYFTAVEGERVAVERSSIKGWLAVKRLSDGRKGFVREDAVGLI